MSITQYRSISWNSDHKLFSNLFKLFKLFGDAPIHHAQNRKKWCKHILPEVKAVIPLIFHGFTTLQLNGLDNRYSKTPVSRFIVKMQQSPSDHQPLTVDGGTFTANSFFHTNMDTAAGLKLVIGLPSSDTTVTEKTAQTHSYIQFAGETLKLKKK